MTPSLTTPGASPPSPRRIGEPPLLSVQDLTVSFRAAAGTRIRAVMGVSLSVFPRQTLAIVGESGSGKSVTALSVLRLLPSQSASIDRGRIMLGDGGSQTDLLALSPSAMRRVRGPQIAMIFQEPMSSLNPVFTVGEQIMECVRLHQGTTPRDARIAAEHAMREVGMPDPAGSLRAYPHEFSGGMRQRAMIAMALACNPRLLLADEPTTALDVTVQAQVLHLLRALQRRTEMGIILITHSLGVVSEQADVVCVMLAGRVVEYARVKELLERPLHPYTRGLLASAPTLRERRERLRTVADIVGEQGAMEIPISGLGSERATAWWPPASPLDGAAAGPGIDDCLLLEAEPGRWVGVRRTEQLSHLMPRPPELEFQPERGSGE